MRVAMIPQVAVDEIQLTVPKNQKEASASVLDFLSIWLSLFAQTPAKAVQQTIEQPGGEEEIVPETAAAEQNEALMAFASQALGNLYADVPAQLPVFTTSDSPSDILAAAETMQPVQVLQPQQHWQQNVENFISRQAEQDTSMGKLAISDGFAIENTEAFLENIAAGEEVAAAEEAESVKVIVKADESEKTAITRQAPAEELTFKEEQIFTEISSTNTVKTAVTQENVKDKPLQEVENLSKREDPRQLKNKAVDKQGQAWQQAKFTLPAGETNSKDNSDVLPLRASIMEQVWEQLSFADLPTGEKKLYVRLKPETLGQLEIHLRLQKGQLTAQIITDNAQVKQALEASLQQLRERLQAQQITVTEFTVSIGQEASYGQQQAPWQQQFMQRPGLLYRADLTEETAAPMVAVNVSPGLDLRA